MTAGAFRPAISASGSWIAEAAAARGTLLLTRIDAGLEKSKAIPLGAARIFWYRWSSDPDDALLVSCELAGRTVILRIDPATGAPVAITAPTDMPVLSLASYTNGYAFTYDRFRDSVSAVVADLGPDGKLVPRPEPGNALPAYLGVKDAYMDLRIAANGQTFLFGRDSEHPARIALSPQALRMGAGLVSVNAEGKAFLLAADDTDTLGLLELDLRSGSRRTLVQENVDIRRVILNPVSLAPEAVELERSEPQLLLLGAALCKDVDFLAAAGWGTPQIVDRSPDDALWLVKYGSRDGAPIWTVYDRRKSTLRPVRLGSAASAGPARWQVHGFALERPGEPALTGYLTLPRAGLCAPAGCPLVLKLHGGPALRDVAELDQERFWLLDRGIAVATINFRGSRGFGKQYESLDRRQWALGIPRDVEDGLAHVLHAFAVDRARIAVVGTSFSGYLALALAAQDTRIKCAVIDSAATDMVGFVDDSIKKFGDQSDLIERLGDARIATDRAALAAMSPVNRIDGLKSLDLLQLHGAQDRTVAIANNQPFVQKMLAQDPGFTYVSLPSEGHGLPGARLAYYALTEQFLGRCLGVAVEPLGASDRAALAGFGIEGNRAID